MILYSFILYNYFVLYRFYGAHFQIYPSAYKQKTPLLDKAPTGCDTIPRFTHRGGVCPSKACPSFDIYMIKDDYV